MKIKAAFTLVAILVLLTSACRKAVPEKSAPTTEKHGLIPRKVQWLELGVTTEAEAKRRINKLIGTCSAKFPDDHKSKCGNYLSLPHNRYVIVFPPTEQATNGHMVAIELIFICGKLWEISTDYGYEKGNFDVALNEAIEKYGGAADLGGSYNLCDEKETCLTILKTLDIDNKSNDFFNIPKTSYVAKYADYKIQLQWFAHNSSCEK